MFCQQHLLTITVCTKSVRKLDFIIIFIIIVTQIIIIRDLVTTCVFHSLVYNAIYESWSDITHNINLPFCSCTINKLSDGYATGQCTSTYSEPLNIYNYNHKALFTIIMFHHYTYYSPLEAFRINISK